MAMGEPPLPAPAARGEGRGEGKSSVSNEASWRVASLMDKSTSSPWPSPPLVVEERESCVAGTSCASSALAFTRRADGNRDGPPP